MALLVTTLFMAWGMATDSASAVLVQSENRTLSLINCKCQSLLTPWGTVLLLRKRDVYDIYAVCMSESNAVFR